MSSPSDPAIEFDRLLAPHLPTAVAYARAIVGNRHDAEDAVQDAVLKGLQAFGSFQPAQPFKPWWLTILRNTCKDQLRFSRRWLRALNGWARLHSPSSAEDMPHYEAVLLALRRLPPQPREILELKYLAGCTYAEIAEVLGIPRGTVMSRLHAARQQFARCYQQEPS